MAPKIESLNRRYLRGMLESLRENTRGADDEIRMMMSKLDSGELRWIGKSTLSSRRMKRDFHS